jgi:hypothetical protein
VYGCRVVVVVVVVVVLVAVVVVCCCRCCSHHCMHVIGIREARCGVLLLGLVLSLGRHVVVRVADGHVARPAASGAALGAQLRAAGRRCTSADAGLAVVGG